MPAGRGKDAERFAKAVDEGRSPSAADGGGLARELGIVAMLRSSGAAYAPDPDARARSRRRLMETLAAEAGAPTAMETTLPISATRLAPTPSERVDALRDSDEHVTEITTRIAPIVDEDSSVADERDAAVEIDDDRAGAAGAGHDLVRSRSGRRTGRHTMPSKASSRPGRSAGSPRPGGRSLVRRALLTGSAALLALVAIAGGGVFASRNALPGDGLYGVKRVAESAGLALTFDEAAKAARHLELASTRLGEVEQLVDQRGEAQADPALVQGAIQDFDSATGEGSKLILTEDEAHDPGKLGDLQAWAAEQVSRISTLRSGLPTSAQAEADRSITLLDGLRERAAALEDRSSCTDVTSGESDDIGPLPASSACDSASTDEVDATTSDAETDDPNARSSADPPSSPSVTGSTPAPPGGLLPGVVGGDRTSSSAPTSGTSDADESAPTSSTNPPSPLSLPLPLPLLPPINLPPLLPGGQGITIG